MTNDQVPMTNDEQTHPNTSILRIRRAKRVACVRHPVQPAQKHGTNGRTGLRETYPHREPVIRN